MDKHKVNLGTARLFIINGKSRFGILAGSHSNIQNIVTLKGEHFRLVISKNADINESNYREEKIPMSDGRTKVIRYFEDGRIESQVFEGRIHF